MSWWTSQDWCRRAGDEALLCGFLVSLSIWGRVVGCWTFVVLNRTKCWKMLEASRSISKQSWNLHFSPGPVSACSFSESASFCHFQSAKRFGRSLQPWQDWFTGWVNPIPKKPDTSSDASNEFIWILMTLGCHKMQAVLAVLVCTCTLRKRIAIKRSNPAPQIRKPISQVLRRAWSSQDWWNLPVRFQDDFWVSCGCQGLETGWSVYQRGGDIARCLSKNKATRESRFTPNRQSCQFKVSILSVFTLFFNGMVLAIMCTWTRRSWTVSLQVFRKMPMQRSPRIRWHGRYGTAYATLHITCISTSVTVPTSCQNYPNSNGSSHSPVWILGNNMKQSRLQCRAWGFFYAFQDMVHLILCLLVFWTIARDKASEGESAASSTRATRWTKMT